MTDAEFKKLVLEKLQAIETRQDEIYNVVRAIEHANNIAKSELDKQSVRVAKIEGKLKQTGKSLLEGIDIEDVSNL